MPKTGVGFYSNIPFAKLDPLSRDFLWTKKLMVVRAIPGNQLQLNIYPDVNIVENEKLKNLIAGEEHE